MPVHKRSYSARAVVTGAGSGIGRAFALELARRGGQVVCADIDLLRAQETAVQIGPRALAVACDVSVHDDVVALSKAAEEFLSGPVDLVINNAGVGSGGLPVGELPIEDWQWVLGINLYGVIYGCHVFTPGMRETGRGGIINVASAAAFGAMPEMSAYNVSKAGVLALSETLAAELSGTDIRVTALCPTFVKTNVVHDGRIGSQSGELAEKLMRWTGMTAEAVAVHTLDEHDKGHLHVIPQRHARVLWATKRLLPGPYTKAMGLGFRAVSAIAKKI
jgi:NAD(P)-dependent dehydrogenase (short-subunit alcohol dehydrogenase family)